MWIGFVDLESTLYFWLVTKSSGTPTTADSAPTYRIYGPDPTATMSGGTGTMSGIIDSQTGFYKGSHSIAAATGFAVGSTYMVKIAYAISSAAKGDELTFTVR